MDPCTSIAAKLPEFNDFHAANLNDVHPMPDPDAEFNVPILANDVAPSARCVDSSTSIAASVSSECAYVTRLLSSFLDCFQFVESYCISEIDVCQFFGRVSVGGY